MKEIIAFLNELRQNNNREWFVANKDEYLKCQAKFNAMTEQLILKISAFDPSVAGLTVKDCTYRIYRDVRFSNDKSPYKCHFGAYVCRGGKKSGYAGYYFHIGVGGEGYPYSHMLAVGDYRYNPEALKILREDICYGKGDFDKIIKNGISPLFHLEEDDKLTRVPKGFPQDSPYADYLKLKTYGLCYEPSTDFMLADDVLDKAVELFQTTYPFVQYVNRAIEYSKEVAF